MRQKWDGDESGWQPFSLSLARGSTLRSACEYAVALAGNLPPTSPEAQSLLIRYVAIPTARVLLKRNNGPIVLPLLAKRALDSHFVCTKLGFCPDDNSTTSGCAFKRGQGQQPEPSCFPPAEKDTAAAATAATTVHRGERTTSLLAETERGETTTTCDVAWRFLHVTDIHVDYEYLAVANAMCGPRVRWVKRAIRRRRQATFGRGQGADDGDGVGVDLVIFTGDLVPHILWKGKKVYASLGNHDGMLEDQASIRDCKPTDCCFAQVVFLATTFCYSVS
eukprot:jgi/Chlat1/1922/Chrsp152S02236